MLKAAQQRISSIQGFTLIELLIVIAVLGVLAVVIVVGLNPPQMLARTRDSGRISGVNQLGRATEAYASARNGDYPDEAATWITELVDAGELSTVPGAINYSIAGIAACTTNAQNSWCYDATTAAGGGPVVTFVRLEATSNISRCAAGQWAYSVWSSADARGGIVCTAANAAPAPGNQTFLP